ncbi:MAG: hypothetical protein NVV66_07005 [Cellulomonas sp.]|uniref:hypothetical protein n=1 Tax=Cellulomonas sp. TaxID=40001 RepID=UPI0025905C2A|nr:hypothetical protein [Cellulomonas sp.]MCR6704442.1 hypothetical protein [Cellulomonas sp.]
MPRATARRRWSLTRYFGVVSFLAMLALGVALIWMTGRVMQEQSVRDGTQSATSVMSYAAAPLPTHAFAEGLLTDAQVTAIETSTMGFGSRIVELRLWSTAGVLMYSADATGGAFPDTERLNGVLASGSADARVLDDVNQVDAAGTGATIQEVLDVYVPVGARDAQDLSGIEIGSPLPSRPRSRRARSTRSSVWPR